MMSALFQINKLSWIYIVLAHWNNRPQIDMSLHSDTLLFWFHYYCYLIKFDFAIIFKMVWLFPCICFFYLQLVPIPLNIACFLVKILTAPLFIFPIFIQLVPTTLNIAYYLINIDCSPVYIFCFYQQVPTIHTRDYHYQQNVWPVHLACIVISLDCLLLLEIVPLVTCV